MYSITRKIEIDAGHRIPFHDSKCRRLHGHRYVIEATAEARQTVSYGDGEEESSAGMLVDFGDLKRVLMSEIDSRFDHRTMVWEDDPLWGYLGDVAEKEAAGFVYVPCIPTAEELARYWFGLVDAKLRGLFHQRMAEGLKLVALTVWETPNCWATYRAEEEGNVDGN